MEFNDLIEFVEKITRSTCNGLYYCVPWKSLYTTTIVDVFALYGHLKINYIVMTQCLLYLLITLLREQQLYQRYTSIRLGLDQYSN